MWYFGVFSKFLTIFGNFDFFFLGDTGMPRDQARKNIGIFFKKKHLCSHFCDSCLFEPKLYDSYLGNGRKKLEIKKNNRTCITDFRTDIRFFGQKVVWGGAPPTAGYWLYEYIHGYGMVCGVSLGGGLMIDIFFF